LQATQTIEGYDSFEQIALGGMAAVYKARKMSLDMPVAIKVLFPHLAQDAIYIERFKREARAAARVQHDSIVNVIDYGESDGSHYIVMEYYDGVNLEELLETQTIIPLDICFAVLLNVCYGLEEAHAVSLVHRDIKPANVIFTMNGGVKIADFGLAKAIDKLKSVTQHGKILGTPAYMSPEQTRGDEVSTQSDIFSLGVVAYEFATGQRPFDGRSYAEVVDKIQNEEAEPVESINPLIGESFAAIIKRMLTKDLKTRYEHASEIVMDLEEAMDVAGYKRERRILGQYIREPGKYLDKFKQKLLDGLRSGDPEPAAGKKAAEVHFRKILYLDPKDERARNELARVSAAGTAEFDPPPAATERAPKRRTQAGPGGGKKKTAGVQYDPNADYRVYLDSIDLSRESPPSFALKLSMRIRSPLPRIMAIVKNMPAMVGGRLSIDKAKRLANVIVDLGGIARIELHPINESTGDHPSPSAKPAPKPAPAPAPKPKPRPKRAPKPKPVNRPQSSATTGPSATASSSSTTGPSATTGSSSMAGPPPSPRGPRWNLDDERVPEVAGAESQPADVTLDDAVCDDIVNDAAGDDSRLKTEEHKPIIARRDEAPRENPAKRDRSTRECPKCGWEEDVDAKFCSVCRCSFNKTEPLNLARLQNGEQPENPLRNARVPHFDPDEMMSWFQRLPDSMKYGGLAGLIILLLLIVFGR
jgi:serine/threonine protein kinase